MKKFIGWIIMMAGLLLLASCRPQGNVGPIEIPESRFTPTPIVVPTCTPTEEPAQTVVPSPTNTTTPVAETPTPTVVDEPVLKPTAAPTPETSPTLTVTPTVEATPTEVATATPKPSPTNTVTPVPTKAEPSPTPKPTATPTPTSTPVPTATPTPTVNPESLVTNGWQKTESFDEKYVVVFPEIFRDSSLAKTEKKLRIGYTSPEDETIEFVISYTIGRTLEESVEEILQAGGIVVEQIPEEQRVSYLLYKDGKMYQGILLEEEYAKELLGSSFGEDGFITGVMNVVFSYPKERSKEYQAEQYSYYVVKNREEN